MRVSYSRVFSIFVKAGVPTLLIAGGLMTAHTPKLAASESTATKSAAWIAEDSQATQGPPTVEEARKFAEDAEARLLDLWVKGSRAQWVMETYITPDTEQISAEADQQLKAAVSELAAKSRRFDGMELPPDVARKLKLIKLSVDIPSPQNPKESAELSQINASLQSDYGKGKWCPNGTAGGSGGGSGGKCLELSDLEHIMATSRDPAELEKAWAGWHAIAPPMKAGYSRMVY